MVKGLRCHVIDQSAEQFGNVASESGIDRSGLDPCVLDCVVQCVNVLGRATHSEIGVLAVKQFMDHKANILGQVFAGHDRVIAHVCKANLALGTDRGSLSAFAPFDGH